MDAPEYGRLRACSPSRGRGRVRRGRGRRHRHPAAARSMPSIRVDHAESSPSRISRGAPRPATPAVESRTRACPRTPASSRPGPGVGVLALPAKRAGAAASPRRSPATTAASTPVIAEILFMAGMGRSEVGALRWADSTTRPPATGFWSTVRRGKTSPVPADRVVELSRKAVGLRFQAAALGPPNVEHVTAYSGQVGLASELTSRGVEHRRDARGKLGTSRMVAHYSTGGDRRARGGGAVPFEQDRRQARRMQPPLSVRGSV